MSSAVVHESYTRYARSRQTGTHSAVVDNRDCSFSDSPDEPWYTICDEHGMICSHDSRRVAERFAPYPAEWCEVCQLLVEARDPEKGARFPQAPRERLAAILTEFHDPYEWDENRFEKELAEVGEMSDEDVARMLGEKSINTKER